MPQYRLDTWRIYAKPRFVPITGPPAVETYQSFFARHFPCGTPSAVKVKVRPLTMTCSTKTLTDAGKEQSQYGAASTTASASTRARAGSNAGSA